MRRPNILFIMADQMRADAIVSEWQAPNLCKLAALGCRFTNAFANSAECIPSRISLATGLYPHQTGVRNNRPCTLNPDIPNWMQALESAGYRTSLFGKTHLHPHAGDLRDRMSLMHAYGLQEVDETGGPRALAHIRCNLTDLWQKEGVWEKYAADVKDRFATTPFVVRPTPLPLHLYYDTYVGRTARDYLERLQPSDQPWFCWVSFGGPHEPWDVPEPYASLFSPGDMQPAVPRRSDTRALRGSLKRAYESPVYSPAGLTAEVVAAMRANYAGGVRLIDDQIGGILDSIRARGDMDNTLIVFTSDHGEMNGDEGLIYKANFLDPAIRVPLIVKPPLSSQTPGVSSALVELMDVGATFTDYAGAGQAIQSNARSLKPLLQQSSRDHREFCVCEFGVQGCLITDSYKAEFDPKLACDFMIDRASDPMEADDVSQTQAAQPEVDRIRQAYRKQISETPIVSRVALEDEK